MEVVASHIAKMGKLSQSGSTHNGVFVSDECTDPHVLMPLLFIMEILFKLELAMARSFGICIIMDASVIMAATRNKHFPFTVKAIPGTTKVTST